MLYIYAKPVQEAKARTRSNHAKMVKELLEEEETNSTDRGCCARTFPPFCEICCIAVVILQLQDSAAMAEVQLGICPRSTHITIHITALIAI
jgi:hypothetical protein